MTTEEKIAEFLLMFWCNTFHNRFHRFPKHGMPDWRDYCSRCNSRRIHYL